MLGLLMQPYAEYMGDLCAPLPTPPLESPSRSITPTGSALKHVFELRH